MKIHSYLKLMSRIGKINHSSEVVLSQLPRKGLWKLVQDLSLNFLANTDQIR